MWVTAPITWPFGWVLDKVLGQESPVLKRKQLKAMVDLHGEEGGGFVVHQPYLST